MSLASVAADVAEFVVNELGLVTLLRDAIAGGVSRDELVADLKAKITRARVAASDAQMDAELGPASPKDGG